MNFSELKLDAKQKMKGKYSEAIIMMLVFGVISFIAAQFDLALSKSLGMVTEDSQNTLNIFTLLVSIIFGLGITSFFLKISRGESPQWKEMYSKTNRIPDYFVLNLLIGIFVFLWTLLLIIPGIIASISYSLAQYIMLDEPNLSPMDCIRKSKEMMKGHKGECFCLALSFIGWIILGIFTLGILYFWLVPYMSVTMCNFYNKLKGDKVTSKKPKLVQKEEKA